MSISKINPRLKLIIALFWGLNAIKAQEFGGIPQSIKWRQLDNNQVRVIYPDGLFHTAGKIALISAYLDSTTYTSLGQKSRKIDIILQPFTSISNGYVALAPWKSEFYLTPFQNALTLGSTDWSTLLSVHEFRHVQQYSNFHHGLSKWLYFFFGQNGQALANSAAIPNWFFEGDAVFQETEITGLGRGRLPDFFAEYRSIWESKRNYSYMKLRNGSYRSLIPDHYSMGYMFVSYGNQTYSKDFWKKVTYEAASFKSPLYPFQKAIRNHSGLTFKKFVDKAFDFYKNDISAKTDDFYQQITLNSNKYVKNVSFPTFIGSDSVLYLKTTGDRVPSWYVLHAGKERKLATRDISIDDQFSYRNGFIAYTYFKPDLRWGMQNFNGIALLDVKTGERKYLNQKGRFFSPDISPDTKSIVAVKINEDESSELQLFDIEGNLIQSMKDSSLLYSYPKFSADGNSVYACVRDLEGRMNIIKRNLSTNTSTLIIPWSDNPISFTSVKEDSVFFTVSFKGIDRLMCWDEKNQQLFKVISKYTGVKQADFFQNEFVFTSTNAYGVQLFKTSGKWEPLAQNEWIEPPLDLYGFSSPDHNLRTIAPAKIDTAFIQKKYTKTNRIINIHSWSPLWEQPDWSFHLYGNNVLNTSLSDFYYQYNSNEKFHKLGADLSYSGLYPWITGGTSYTFGRNISLPGGKVFWDELNAKAGLRLPLNFTKGRSYSGMNLQTTYNLNSIYAKPGSAEVLSNSKFSFMENVLNFNVRSQKALQHINSRLGISFLARHRFGIKNPAVNQILLNSNLFLPGILRNHSLVLTASFQSRDTLRQYSYSNGFPFSRGYEALNYPRMWRGSFNYHLPLFYPDWGFAQMIYFLRIRTNLFYDHTVVKSLRTGLSQKIRSVGAELFFDTKFWNQQNLTFGIRYSRLLDVKIYTQPAPINNWQLILPLDFINL